jgi:hypothetical protein
MAASDNQGYRQNHLISNGRGLTMSAKLSLQRSGEAVEEFDRHEDRQDGLRIVRSLVDGLNMLRDMTFRRVHEDVQQMYGLDSMLMPVSLEKSERQTKTEIEVFQVVETTAAARDREYVRRDDDWFADWLARLRLGDDAGSETCQNRLTSYFGQSADERRLAFSDVLAEVFPESRRAPLVMFRLLPRAVHIVASLAFRDHLTATELRSRQILHLPAIEDCQDCDGMVLENGESCHRCGNPLWNYQWLTSSD